MALIVLRDLKLRRERIINTDYIFHCIETEGGVRVNYSEGGASGRDHCIVAGTLADFAKAVGAAKVG